MWFLIQSGLMGGIFYWAQHQTWPTDKPSAGAIFVIAWFVAYAVTVLASAAIDGIRKLSLRLRFGSVVAGKRGRH